MYKQGPLKNRPWSIRKCVLPQHTDHAGVMWHGAYLSWLEESRVDALTKAGLPYKQLSNEGYFLPVVHIDINYLIPLFHGEEVSLESWSIPRKGIRFSLYTAFINENGVRAAFSEVELVLVRVTKNGQKAVRNPPDYFLEAIKLLQSGPEQLL